MGWLNGWPPLESSQNDMHPETVTVFEWCLLAETRLAETDSSHLLAIGESIVDALLREQRGG